MSRRESRAVSMITGTWRSSGSRRRAWTSSNPVITGIKPIDIFVGVLEFVSEIAKIVSFSFRLFGNIFAGQVLLFVMPFLVALIVPVAFFGLELFVGFMQAFVSAILTLIFMSMATVGHGPDSDHH